MPRKPKPPQKKKITVPVNGRMIDVTLTPPTGSKASWYAYWSDLEFARSTRQSSYDEAVKAVQSMLLNGGRKSDLSDVILTDDEFDRIQRKHYSKKTDPAAKKRADKSLTACMEAIKAFRQLTGVHPVATATPEDCERFQIDALKLPKDWRANYATERPVSERKRGEAEPISPNTIIKWSVALQAAFERCNRNAGQKCVRSVVSNEKLLTENPWKQFTWIEGRDKPRRQFDASELISLLDFFDEQWPAVTFAPAFVKVALWSWARREEISSLKWDQLRKVGREFHFDSVGKWNVRKWFRLPENLVNELKSLRNSSPYLFGTFPEQLRAFHIRCGNKTAVKNIRADFRPINLGDWMYRQVKSWSDSSAKGSAYLHIFRKTSLQFARRGEDLNQLVASDASLTAAVMTSSYTEELDDELRHKSNRTFIRILKSLPVDVATRYGYEERPSDRLIEQLDLARSAEDWSQVIQFANALQSLVDSAGAAGRRTA